MFVQSVSEGVNARCHIKIFLVAFKQTKKCIFVLFLVHFYQGKSPHKFYQCH